MMNEAQLTRLGLFDAKAPRYTSYPTAPHFNSAVGAANFTRWLADLKPNSEISLYVHVPFCRRLCWFCACRTQGTASENPVVAYAQTLHAELELLRRHLPRGVKLSRLHWGGGTPSLLPAPEITRLAAAIFATLPLAAGGEFSVEIDPNEADPERLDALVAAGMNRASVGVQDFDPEIQKAIGREQSYEITKKVIEALRARGVQSLNADILYGLPYQDEARISASVAKLLSLSPDRVALYGYAHVPWMSRRQQLIPTEHLPSAVERLALFETARQMFKAAGYVDIGIDHFAKPHDGLAIAQNAGRLKRNFQGYTDDQSEVLIGMGASSISRFPQGYAQNAAATMEYTKAIQAGQFSVAKGHAFCGDDRLNARIIEALMCDFRVELRELVDRFDADPQSVQAKFQKVAAQFEGVLSHDATGLSIPVAARPLTRMVAQAFDAYDMAAARHSLAV